MIQKDPEVDRHTSIEDSKVIFNDRIFGDECKTKHKNIMRMMFLNVNGFGNSHQSVKTLSIRNLMYRNEVDVMAMAETNRNWGNIRRPNTLPQIARRWFQTSKTVISYNQHEKRKKKNNAHQPGGTAIVSKGEMALRVKSNSYDKKKMGRWASQVFQGKQGISTRIISVYVPNSVYKHGNKKVWCQQQKALLKTGETRNVLEVFWEDFWQQIDLWLLAGDQLIIGGDWNTNVSNPSFLEPFKKRNLVPVMSNKFDSPLPATHNNGSQAIDEIFASSTISIQAAGYLEHGSTLSDHCPLWVDVTKDTLIGTKATLKPTYATRKLKTDDPRVVRKYLNKLEELLLRDNVVARTNILRNNIGNQKYMTEEQILEFESLDSLRHKAMKEAEQQCRKIKAGAVKWCPKIQRVRDKIEYLSLTKRRKLGRKVGARTLYRLSKRVACTVEHLSVEEIEGELDKTFTQYRLLKKNQLKNREDFITGLAAALEQKGKGKKATIVQQLIAKETQRDMWRKIAMVNGKMADLSTKFVTIKTEGGTKTISEKIQLEKAIIKENKHKYHQTESTCPFMQPPLRNDFGDLGKGPGTEKVLNGEYIPSLNLTPSTQEYIKLCSLPKGELIMNPLTRSLDYFNQSWRKMREQTSSRDIHFGHFRAATEQNKIMNLHYQLAEIPFRTGYSPTRWKKATNVMILKKEGNTDIDKLRTLVLFEADFNHNNKFLGRSMMHHMVDSNALAKEQYSSPGKKCIDHVVNRKLYFDLVRYQKTSAAMSGVDLKSCYDRVSHAPAYLAMRSFGIPSEPIESMFQSIQDMQYYTMTSHGISETSFGGKEEGYIAAPNGLGQGNGSGPAVWSVVSSKMFQVMHKRGASTTMKSPITKDEIDLCGFAFVDDSDLIAMSESDNDPIEARENMQKVVNEWEGVCKTTGGALVPKKCWSWIISFDWDKDSWTYRDSKEEHRMTVKDADGVTKNIQLLNPAEAKEMLGVKLAPDGNQEQQLVAIKEKMSLFAEKIRTGHVTRHEAWMSLSMVALKSLEYMMPAMHLSERDYNEIMKPVLQQFLPKMGINRNISRDILYSPTEVQGFNLKNPYILQGVIHVRDVSEHLWKDTLTGKLLKINLEQLRLELGCNVDILASNYEDYRQLILTDSHISQTWQFMSKHQISLQDNTPRVPLLRKNDACLMEIFLKHKNIKTEWIPTLNKCRTFLKVFSVADITTGSGKAIRDEAWHGRRFQVGRDTSKWPIWGRPSLLSWNTWRTALQIAVCQCRGKRLYTPLGSWTVIPNTWPWFHYNKNNYDILIHKHENGYKAHKRIGRSNLKKRYQESSVEVTGIKPSSMIPATIKYSHKSIIMDTNTQLNIVNEQKAEKDNTLSTLWLNVEKYQSGSVRKIAEAIENGTAIAVSDGSYVEDRGVGSASWIISSKTKEHYVTAGAISPGPRSIQSSYRSEVLGLLGILENVYNICHTWNITHGKCTIFCDGLSALQQVEESTIETTNTRQSCSDLLSACAQLKSMIPVQLRYTHVKGHQDDDKPIHTLTVPAQLNTLMDTLAKDLIPHIEESHATHIPQHQLSFPLPIHSTIIRDNMKDTLYNSIMTEVGHNYWMRKGRYTPSQRNNIEWHAQYKAMKAINSTRQRTLSKWFSGWLGTGKNMRRWKLRYASNCPFCGHLDEDTNHVLKCSHPKVTTNWTSLLKAYDIKLAKGKTCYALRKAIILELRAWRNMDTAPSLSFADPQLKQAIQAQREVGWRCFLEGLMVKDIITYQTEYLASNYPLHNSASWTKKIYRLG